MTAKIDLTELSDADGKARCVAPGCKKQGYYRYGVCSSCRPKCDICAKPINNRPYGETRHIGCAAQKFKLDNLDNSEMYKRKGRPGHGPTAER